MHLVQRSTSLRIPSTKKVFGWSRNYLCTAWISSSLAIPGVSTPYSAFWVLARSDGPMFHLLWLFCSKILVPPWCTLLAERPSLHCHSSKENDAIKVKLRSRDHSSTNSKHACSEGSVTNLKRCYGESADNFWLTYILSMLVHSASRYKQRNVCLAVLFLQQGQRNSCENKANTTHSLLALAAVQKRFNK
jgi:hypothetical protein